MDFVEWFGIVVNVFWVPWNRLLIKELEEAILFIFMI